VNYVHLNSADFSANYGDNMAEIIQTALYELHISLGAKMVPFAGYEMPVQYTTGVMKEHIHTRNKVGLFDVSHMGQIIIRPKNGNLSDIAASLEKLIPIDIIDLPKYQQRYGFFTNNHGGIIDDLMVSNQGDHLFLVVNAGCKKTDFEHLRENLGENCKLEVLENRSLIALQGPKAEKVLSELSNQIIDMNFMDTLKIQLQGFEVWISRSGYTGEDGFEISIPNENINKFTEHLLNNEDVLPIGLGARDSLRLEAGLCLYGHDIDQNSSPSEAGLNWAISKKRRNNGIRCGNFLGSKRILNEISNGADIKRVGIVPTGRAPMREGVELFKDSNDTRPIGRVTSGGFGPTVEKAISMGYLETSYTKVNTKIFAEIRGKRMEAVVTSLPFTKLNFKRSN